MNKIEWLTDGVTPMPDIDAPLLEKWIAAVAKTHNRIVGPLTYIFCDDPKIIEMHALEPGREVEKADAVFLFARANGVRRHVYFP